MSTFEDLKLRLEKAGRVELRYSLGSRVLSGLTRFTLSGTREPQLIVTAEGVWAAVDNCPPEGWAWSHILDVHLVKHQFRTVVELTVTDGTSADGRSRLRLPHGLTIRAQDIALWLASELSSRGSPL